MRIFHSIAILSILMAVTCGTPVRATYEPLSPEEIPQEDLPDDRFGLRDDLLSSNREDDLYISITRSFSRELPEEWRHACVLWIQKNIPNLTCDSISSLARAYRRGREKGIASMPKELCDALCETYEEMILYYRVPNHIQRLAAKPSKLFSTFSAFGQEVPANISGFYEQRWMNALQKSVFELPNDCQRKGVPMPDGMYPMWEKRALEGLYATLDLEDLEDIQKRLGEGTLNVWDTDWEETLEKFGEVEKWTQKAISYEHLADMVTIAARWGREKIADDLQEFIRD